MVTCQVATLCLLGAILLTTSSAHLGSADVEAANPTAVYNATIASEEKESITSVLKQIDDVVRKHFSYRKGQRINAFSAFVIGLMLLVIDCQAVFKWFGVGCVVLLATLLTMNEIEARWQLGDASGAAPIIGVEVGLAAGYAALRGYQGLKVLIGACLGAFLAHLVRMLCFHLGFHGFQPDHEAANVCLYSVFIISSVVMIRQKASLTPLAYITPFLGGALMSAAVLWFMDWDSDEGSMHPFVNYVRVLCTSKVDEVGLFPNGPQDRHYGVLLWIVLFLVGSFRQRMIVKNKEKLVVESN